MLFMFSCFHVRFVITNSKTVQKQAGIKSKYWGSRKGCGRKGGRFGRFCFVSFFLVILFGIFSLVIWLGVGGLVWQTWFGKFLWQAWFGRLVWSCVVWFGIFSSLLFPFSSHLAWRQSQCIFLSLTPLQKSTSYLVLHCTAGNKYYIVHESALAIRVCWTPKGHIGHMMEVYHWFWSLNTQNMYNFRSCC